jgi:type IV pilus assembly protein PilE
MQLQCAGTRQCYLQFQTHNNRETDVKIKSRIRGVTLVELMVVVAIVGILGTIAVSSYRNSTMRSRRAEAKIALMTIKVEQEKFFLQNRQYATTVTALNVPAITAHSYYNIGLTTSSANSQYSATATATGGQTGDTDCQVFTVDGIGNQTSTNSSGTSSTAICWR